MDQITSFSQLLSFTKRLVISKNRARAALIGADEPSYLKMMMRASEEGLVDPILIGPKNDIESFAAMHELSLDTAEIINLESRVDMVTEAIKLSTGGRVDFLVRGNMTSGLMLARMFERPTGVRVGDNHVSHVAVFEHEIYPRFLIMSDGGVTVVPDIDQKLAIIQNAVGVANLLGVEMPRVGVLAAVEMVYSAMPVTLDGAVLSKMQDNGQITNCYIDGPLSMDVAVVPEAAEQKGVNSKVAGQADIIIAPNIETGNGIYKAMSMFARAKTAGVIVGSRVPIAVASRCDSSENIFNSLVMASHIALINK
jgi:phosphate butyryltransferase